MELYNRWQLDAVKQALKQRRVLILAGARQCGKTTLAKYLASSDTIYRTLDSTQLLEAALSDPEGFISHDNELMIIDEIQRAPMLLQAIKKNVDENQKYGRFLLTGSANIQSLPGVTESLAGRVTKIRLRPLACGEIYGKQPDFLEKAFDGQFDTTFPHPSDSFSKYDKDAYLKLAFRGGYPELMRIEENNRKRWHKDYVDALIDRDLQDIVNIRRKDSMHRLLNVLASWSTKYMNIQSIGTDLSIQRVTIETYINALETLYLIDRVKSWVNTDYEGVRKKDKLLMTDTGSMTSILRWRHDQVRLDGERNGKLIETFVYNQLISVIEAQSEQYEIYHYRDAYDREVDFLVENEQGDLLGIEVKAGTAVTRDSFKHLKWFNDNLAKQRKFKGIVFYTGEEVLSFGKSLWAIPINSLWA